MLRRPSIPFEAIGLGYRQRLLARAAGTLLDRAKENVTMTQPPRDPTQVPEPLQDDVGKVPEDFIEGGEDSDDDSTGFDDDEDDEE